MANERKGWKCGLVAVVAVVAYSTHLGATTCQNLIDRAELIVKGKTVSQQRSEKGVNLELQIEKVLHGKPTVLPGYVLHIHSEEWRQNAPLGYLGIWFLRQGPEGQWALLHTSPRGTPSIQDFCYPALPDWAMPAEFTYQDDAPLIEKVVAEMGAAFLAGHGKDRVWILGEALFMVPTTLGTKVLQQAIRSQDAEIRLAGMYALLERGDMMALRELAVRWETISHPYLRRASLDVLSAGFRNSSPEAIELLGQIATSERQYPVELKRAAAAVLRAIHTKDTLGYLAQLLDSKDAELRYQGMSGLSCFAHALPMRTPESRVNMTFMIPQDAPERKQFRPESEDGIPLIRDYVTVEPFADEACYLAFWRQWWTRHKAALGH